MIRTTLLSSNIPNVYHHFFQHSIPICGWLNPTNRFKPHASVGWWGSHRFVSTIWLANPKYQVSITMIHPLDPVKRWLARHRSKSQYASLAALRVAMMEGGMRICPHFSNHSWRCKKNVGDPAKMVLGGSSVFQIHVCIHLSHYLYLSLSPSLHRRLGEELARGKSKNIYKYLHVIIYIYMSYIKQQ